MFKTADGMYASKPFLKIIITFILHGLHVKYVHGSLQGNYTIETDMNRPSRP